MSRPVFSGPRSTSPLRSSAITRRALRGVALGLVALPLALGLSACHKADSGAATGDTVAAVNPPAGKSWSDVIAATPDHGMVMGNPTAPIKLVEYGSLSCPHCAHLASEAMPSLVGTYVNSGKVSYEYRSFAIHGIDIPLTVLVRCADPSAFFGLVEQLYANQDALLKRAQDGQTAAQAAANLPAAQRMVAMADAYGLPDFFSARGLPVDKARACLTNIAAAQAVAKEAETIGNNGIDSTPTLIINGTKSAALSWPDLEAALKAAGAR
jgi:protein-disulfide isomerase